MTTDMTKERSRDPDKKNWSTPKLRIFVRTKMEERVLWLCKSQSNTGAMAYKPGCYLSASCIGPCQSGAGGS